MKIRLERSGGFTGVPVHVALDSEELSPSDAKALSQMVDGADFFGLPAQTGRKPQARDAFGYRIVVETGSQTHTVEGDDVSLPPSVRELVSFVIERGHREGQPPRRKIRSP